VGLLGRDLLLQLGQTCARRVQIVLGVGTGREHAEEQKRRNEHSNESTC
jgi:hypothetical protein